MRTGFVVEVYDDVEFEVLVLFADTSKTVVALRFMSKEEAGGCANVAVGKVWGHFAEEFCIVCDWCCDFNKPH